MIYEIYLMLMSSHELIEGVILRRESSVWLPHRRHHAWVGLRGHKTKALDLSI